MSFTLNILFMFGSFSCLFTLDAYRTLHYHYIIECHWIIANIFSLSHSVCYGQSLLYLWPFSQSCILANKVTNYFHLPNFSCQIQEESTLFGVFCSGCSESPDRRSTRTCPRLVWWYRNMDRKVPEYCLCYQILSVSSK